MKIVSLNTWAKKGSFEARFLLIRSELIRLKPDIICLQEVFDSELVDLVQSDLSYLHSFTSFSSGLVTISKFPIQKSEAVKYFNKSTIDDNDRQAIFTEILFYDQVIWVGNTHLPWKTEDDALRTQNALEIIQRTQLLTSPIFLAGDFNATPESSAIVELTKSGFIDLFAAGNPDSNGFTWDNARNPYLKTHSVIFPDRRIDLILGKNFESSFSVKNSELVFMEPDGNGNFPSDHFGVIVELISVN